MDGVEIRTLRKKLGLTQEEFAHEIGVTFATVNRWENKKSDPSRLALRMLGALDKKTPREASPPAKPPSHKASAARRSASGGGPRMCAKRGKRAGKRR